MVLLEEEVVLLEEVVDEWSAELEVEEAVELVLAPSAGTASVSLDVHRSQSSGRRIMKRLISKGLVDCEEIDRQISKRLVDYEDIRQISKGLVDYGQKGTLTPLRASSSILAVTPRRNLMISA